VEEESRLEGMVLSSFNTMFIALIPEVDQLHTFDDFRPISLCNCIDKVIVKLLAIRIKPIILREISKSV